MNQTADLMTRAESMGIRIYYQGGLKVDTPWSMGALPDLARHILSELKKRQTEILAHLANTDRVPDFQLQLEALRALGLHLSYDQTEEVKIHCKSILDEHLRTAGTLLDWLLRNHYRGLVGYLKANPQPLPVPG
ncbi:MAG: hypothetical protein JL50_03120 [Peptococcaceae bacterium BICA1-7]|nr:MAG: hypothetical protein JL50_03120 [Peptococcaceae bacterium BICA1-7]HBV97744.1 hypothetical protein [Desulfotomaculum sp.]